LIRRFKKEVGLTPRKFLLQNRIRMAQRLIEQGVSIAEVAQATGFHDQSHFDKRFCHLMGISPRTYRQAARAVPVSTELA
jgi:transcriptional regulator GlxA family with amidase domain